MHHWNVSAACGTLYALYSLENAGAPDSGRVCRIDRFLPDGQFLGAAYIDGWAEQHRNSDPEGWRHKMLIRIGLGDNKVPIALLDYLIEVRQGRVSPFAPPPCPTGGRVKAVGLYECGNHTGLADPHLPQED